MSASLTSEFICWDAAPRNKGQSMRDGESKSWHLGSKVHFYVELAGLSIRRNYHEQSSGWFDDRKRITRFVVTHPCQDQCWHKSMQYVHKSSIIIHQSFYLLGYHQIYSKATAAGRWSSQALHWTKPFRNGSHPPKTVLRRPSRWWWTTSSSGHEYMRWTVFGLCRFWGVQSWHLLFVSVALFV